MARLLPYYQRMSEGVPIIGDWIANAGKVERILTVPCEVDAAIAVQAMFHELPVLLWSLVKPDPVDLTARDVGGSARRRLHGRRRRQQKRPLFRFNVDGLIPGELRTIGKNPWALFKIGDIAQRVGLFIIIVDATSEFAIRWASTTYQWQGCLPTPDWWNGEADAAPTPAGGSGITTWPWLFETAASTPETFIASAIKQPAMTEMVISARLEFTRAQLQSGDAPIDAWLEEVETGATQTIIQQGWVGAEMTATGSIDHVSPLKNDDTTWVIKSSSGSFRIITTPDSTFTAYPATDTFLNADPP